MDRRERVARAIAQVVTASDVDILVLPRWPKLAQVKGGFIIAPRPDAARPLWEQFLDAADAAIAEIEES